MKIVVLHPKVALESATTLAKALKADICNPFEEDRRDFRRYDVVFNYGCHRALYYKSIINDGDVVGICKDKVETFQALKKAGVPCPDFVTRKQNVPKHWEQIVIRETVDGARAEGLDYRLQGEEIPNGALFTEYFPHKYEYRIVVFNGKVVGRYRKQVRNGEWCFQLMHPQGFEEVDKDCVKAAQAIGIDYVGFDVLENKEGKCIILEANSAPIITDEVIEAITKFFKV